MQNRMLLITLILYYASENHENPHTQLHNIPSAHTSILVGCPTKDFCEFALTELHTPV
jgi:hypothetical protein